MYTFYFAEMPQTSDFKNTILLHQKEVREYLDIAVDIERKLLKYVLSILKSIRSKSL